jgi:hypothetical protein
VIIVILFNVVDVLLCSLLETPSVSTFFLSSSSTSRSSIIYNMKK